MASYNTILSNSVRQDVRGIERIQLGRIMAEIRSLSKTPFPPGCKKLKGSRASYRLRVGDYRILYEVDTETRTVIVYRIRHRKDVYQK
ncbi:MAG: type II toxin-antitoxin system RelE family toxin [Syntrophobacteraceae bacterium]